MSKWNHTLKKSDSIWLFCVMNIECWSNLLSFTHWNVMQIRMDEYPFENHIYHSPLPHYWATINRLIIIICIAYNISLIFAFIIQCMFWENSHWTDRSIDINTKYLIQSIVFPLFRKPNRIWHSMCIAISWILIRDKKNEIRFAIKMKHSQVDNNDNMAIDSLTPSQIIHLSMDLILCIHIQWIRSCSTLLNSL